MLKKQTPVTLENIDKLLNKRLNERFDKFEAHFDKKLDENKEELRAEIKYLPTRKQYYEREDKTMGELKDLRDEVAATNDLYEKTNKRVDKIDHHLGISTSVVF
ncbi:MAG TPA: hypothetical protein VL401_03920 [Alphaproteobacteria bacterium]|jgi:hypothetical protein|nr:hypothetical protein [Alphaproteobacteria bacterium]